MAHRVGPYWSPQPKKRAKAEPAEGAAEPQHGLEEATQAFAKLFRAAWKAGAEAQAQMELPNKVKDEECDETGVVEVIDSETEQPEADAWDPEASAPEAEAPEAEVPEDSEAAAFSEVEAWAKYPFRRCQLRRGGCGERTYVNKHWWNVPHGWCWYCTTWEGCTISEVARLNL